MTIVNHEERPSKKWACSGGYEKTIMEYIENQKWDEDAESFKITEPTEP